MTSTDTSSRRITLSSDDAGTARSFVCLIVDRSEPRSGDWLEALYAEARAFQAIAGLSVQLRWIKRDDEGGSQPSSAHGDELQKLAAALIEAGALMVFRDKDGKLDLVAKAPEAADVPDDPRGGEG